MTDRICRDLPKNEVTPPSHPSGPKLTRRQLLAGTGQLALLAALPLGCAPRGNDPFADGTFWNDGSGWST